MTAAVCPSLSWKNKLKKRKKKKRKKQQLKRASCEVPQQYEGLGTAEGRAGTGLLPGAHMAGRAQQHVAMAEALTMGTHTGTHRAGPRHG